MPGKASVINNRTPVREIAAAEQQFYCLWWETHPTQTTEQLFGSGIQVQKRKKEIRHEYKNKKLKVRFVIV